MKTIGSGTFLIILIFSLATGCTGEFLEELDNTSASSLFCPFSRSADGSCPVPEDDISSGPFIVDQVDDDNSAKGFGGGSGNGTQYSAGHLTLNPTLNRTELEQSWTPQWDNLVGYWKLDNNCINEINPETNCTLAAATTFETTSKIGSHSLLVNADGEYAGIPDHSTLDITDKITVGMWIYPLSYVEWQRMAEKNYSTSWYFGGHQNHENSVCVFINSTKLACPTTRQFGFNTWSHVLFTYDKDAGGTDEVKVYVNGTLRATGDYSLPIGVDNDEVTIGSYTDYLPQRFDGYIDDFAIWNTALTKEEVQQIYSR